jgi:hypothetical protein
MREPTPQHLCPRCGYDVSGVVPTWSDSCPLQGRCSECGLVYEWVDIFRPERIYPTWSFEHARSRRVRALMQTTWRVFVPGRLWQEMRLAAPVRVRRLIALVALSLLLAHGAAVLVRLSLSWGELWKTSYTWTGSGTRVLITTFEWDALQSMVFWPYVRWWDRLVGPLGLIVLAWWALSPLPYFVLYQTMAKAKVRRSHLVRAWGYSAVVVSGILLADITLMGVQAYRARAGASPMEAIVWLAVGSCLSLAASAWLFRWWKLFTREYLKLPRSGLITVVMLSISLLAALVVSMIVDPDMAGFAGEWLNNRLGWNAF